MKHLFLYIATTLMLLGSISVNAQTECPGIEWMRFFNNDRNFYCTLSKINNDGSAIVYGSYGDNPNLGNYNLPLAAGGIRRNGFIAKVDSAGNPLWVKTAETIYNNQTRITNPKTDASGNIYATINFARQIEFDGTTYTNSNSQQTNILLVKLNQQGQVLWTKLYENCSFTLLHVDGQSQYYCESTFNGTLSIDAHSYVSNGLNDILVFKLNQQGHLLWAQQIGGTGDENIGYNLYFGPNDDGAWGGLSFCRFDHQSNFYSIGAYKSPVIYLGNTQLTNSNPNQAKCFLAKIDSSGNYQWVKDLPKNLIASDIAIDSSKNVYFCGSIYDTVTIGNTTINVSLSNNGYGYGFLAKYDPVANQFPMVMNFEGGSSEAVRLLYISDKNEMIMSGFFKDTVNFIIQNASSVNGDFFVAGIDLVSSVEQPIPKWVVYSKRGTEAYINNIIKDSDDNTYISGVYNTDSVSFGQYNFPATLSINNTVRNGFQAKLGNFLNRDVSVNNGTLTAVQNSALYQWLDCGNAMQPIPGATGQSFSPAQPGNYAVRVSNSLCSVVSDCINTTGISALQQLQQINIYPNPVQETLNLNHLPLGTHIAVFDVLGRKLFSGVSRESNMKIPTRKWVPGLYVVELNQEGTKYFKKVVKE